MPPIDVIKFGGTSVKNIGRVNHVCDLIEKRARNCALVAVISAMGDTTDYLLHMAYKCAGAPDQRELDHLLAVGEQTSAAIVALTLIGRGLKARSLSAHQIGIVTESVHRKARIVEVNEKGILDALSKGIIAVVAGFQGVTRSGDVTTLGRGGSDTTAVALAVALKARSCDIYTDVDGMFSADPNLIPSALLLPSLTYDEGLEMARLGAEVIHPRAVELAKQYNVRLRIRNTFKPDNAGTLVGKGDPMEVYRAVTGVAVHKEQARVAIIDIPDQPGVAAKIMQCIADRNLVVDMIMQTFHAIKGFNSITFTIPKHELSEAIAALEEVKNALGAKEVLSDSDIAKVSMIGSGLGGNPAISARLFSVLGAAGINIKMIATSEMRITCVVAEAQAEQAARLIHNAFIA